MDIGKIILYLIPLFFSYNLSVSWSLIPRYSCEKLYQYPIAKLSKGCHVNLDILDDVPSIVIRNGYKLETYRISTDDGYIITLFRIPPKEEGAQPIFLVHGILIGCHSWVALGNKSLAYVLHNGGYDVWMVCIRGTSYSRGHVNTSLNQRDYWNFNLDTVVTQDLRKSLKLITEKTNQKSIYFGYSMGATLGIMYTSKYASESQELLKGQVEMAVVEYTKGTSIGIPFVFAPHGIRNFFKLIGVRSFIGHPQAIRVLGMFACSIVPYICLWVIKILSGNDEKQFFNEDMLALVSLADSTSVDMYMQFSQFTKAFHEFDFEKDENVKHYGQQIPPLYNLSDIKIPTYYLYGLNDRIARYYTVEQSFKELGAPIKQLITIPSDKNKKFTHFSFISATDLYNKLHIPMFEVLDQLKRGS